jgi:serine/threonine protein kinase
VERKLPFVLFDKWRANGTQEAANLLFDIAKAVKYLHDAGRVHGDIKPDNIGKRGDNYVLLDFGICRPEDEFSRESTPTGSIRTRAPELLDQRAYLEPRKVDVWALGATVFNSIVGRFPLVKEDEAIPRISSPSERRDFERVISKRAAQDWDKWVTLDLVPEPLRQILSRMLERDVNQRISASDLVQISAVELSAFIPSSSQGAATTGRFSPLEELEQIDDYVSMEKNIRLLPAYRKQQLVTRLNELRTVSGFDDKTKEKIDKLVLTMG